MVKDALIPVTWAHRRNSTIVSFKLGAGRVFELGRPYTLFKEASLRNVMDDLSGENLTNVRISDDLHNSGFRQWLNAVVRTNE